MNDHAIKKLIRRVYRSYNLCDDKSAQETVNELIRVYQAYLANDNGGNSVAARGNWLEVRCLAQQVSDLERQGVIEIVEGKL